MKMKLEYIPLSTEEKRILRRYMKGEDTEYTRQIRANRDKSLQEAQDMHFRVTSTGFVFEMRDDYD